MDYKFDYDETLDITYGEIRTWSRLDDRLKEFFEGNFDAPVFEEDGARIQFRHVYRNEGAYYLAASTGNSEYVLVDINETPGNRWGDAASLETLTGRTTGFQDVGPLTRSLLADIVAGRGIPSIGTVGQGVTAYADDSVLTTTYGYLRELGDSCSDVREWLEENIPAVYEKKATPDTKPLILMYFPGEGDGRLDHPLLVTNNGTGGWDASSPYCSIPEDLKDKVKAFGGGLTGWWLDRGEAEKPIDEILKMMGV